MTRKDYQAIAEVIASTIREWDTNTEGNIPHDVRQTIENIADGLSEVFGEDNGLFDHNKFFRACGLN